MIEYGIKQALLSNPEIAQSFSKWDFGNGPKPSIFTSGRRPDGVCSPLMTMQQISGFNDDTRGSRYPTVDIRLSIMGDDHVSDIDVRRLAERVKRFLHKNTTVQVVGASVQDIRTTSPEPTSDDRDQRGYAVRVTVILKEE